MVTRFEVGDKVVARRTPGCCHRMKDGSEGVVVDIECAFSDDPGYWVKFSTRDLWPRPHPGDGEKHVSQILRVSRGEIEYPTFGPGAKPRVKSVETKEPTTLPTDAKSRKEIPVGTGCLDYFPAALAEVAKVSKAGNDQHNPGQPIHWSRGKSTDHFDTMIRHGMERGTLDSDGQRHSAKMAWRALALLQEELEQDGAPMARGARVDTPVDTPIQAKDAA